jgi:hypothetical protein
VGAMAPSLREGSAYAGEAIGRFPISGRRGIRMSKQKKLVSLNGTWKGDHDVSRKRRRVQAGLVAITRPT